ncbi:MAG: SulP family inorganic anion transporter [Aliidongia sp.]
MRWVSATRAPAASMCSIVSGSPSPRGDPVNPKAVAITVATLVLALLSRRLVRRYRLPQMDMLVVLIIVGLAAFAAGWTVPGSGGKTALAVAGAVPPGLPGLHVPSIKLGWMVQLAPDAAAIACLGLLEALAIAKSIAYETRQSLDFNRQCLAEGLANLTGSFFRCLPGSGSLSRSAINFQSGGATRFSGIVHRDHGRAGRRGTGAARPLRAEAGIGLACCC